MPALSPTMEKGTLAKWLIKEGDVVQIGDPIAEVETDKATMEVEATEAGAIDKLVVAEGTEDVPVGAVIALLGFASDQLRPAPAADAAMIVANATQIPSDRPNVRKADPPAQPVTASALARSPMDVKATPLARRIAAANQVDLAAIVGSGPYGKIVKADLGLADRTVEVVSQTAPARRKNVPACVPFETVKLTGMRKTIANRLTEAKKAIPHFYLGVDVKLDALLSLREDLNSSLREQGVRLSVNDFLIKALAIGLERVSDANVQFAGDELYRFSRVDISVAVAIPGGLVTPVIKDAASKRLSRISFEARDLAGRARAGKLTPEDYQGGTASISNLGMFGMKFIVPVLNPPQALILGVGAAEERPVAFNGNVTIAKMLSVTASFDHRAIDGAIGSEFLRLFKALAEHPVELLA